MRKIASTVLLFLAITGSVPLALAQEATPEPAAEVTQPAADAPRPALLTELTTSLGSANSYLRVANFAPDVAVVDVHFNDIPVLANLDYLAASSWLPALAGTYSVTVTEPGATSENPLAIPFEVRARAQQWQTIVLVGSAANGTLKLFAFSEDYQPLLPGTGGLTFFNALEGSGSVNLLRGNVTYFAQISYPASGAAASSSSLRVDSGITSVEVVATNDWRTIFFERVDVEIPENAYTLLAATGTLGSASIALITTDESAVEIAQGLLPLPGTLLNALANTSNLRRYLQALLADPDAAGLVNGTREFTIFAPADFGMGDGLPPERLRATIVPGKYTTTQLLANRSLTAIDGSPVTVTTFENGIYVNGKLVIDVNIAATNGVIHMLNGRFDGS